MGQNAKQNADIFAGLARGGVADLNRAFGIAAATNEFRLNQSLAEGSRLMTRLGSKAVPFLVDALRTFDAAMIEASKQAEGLIGKLDEMAARARPGLLGRSINDIVNEVLAEARRALFGGTAITATAGGVAGFAVGAEGAPARGNAIPVVSAAQGPDNKGWETWFSQIGDGTTHLDRLRDRLALVQQAGENVATSLADGFADFAETGKLAFGDMVKSMLKDLNRLLLNKLFTVLVNRALGATIPGFNVAFPPGAATAIPRQSGGRVRPGRVYTVGERGRETFRPSVAGAVSPGTSPVQVNVQAPSGFQGRTSERDEGGVRIVDVVFDAVNRGVSEGRFDRAMGQRFGARSQVTRR